MQYSSLIASASVGRCGRSAGPRLLQAALQIGDRDGALGELLVEELAAHQLAKLCEEPDPDAHGPASSVRRAVLRV